MYLNHGSKEQKKSSEPTEEQKVAEYEASLIDTLSQIIIQEAFKQKDEDDE